MGMAPRDTGHSAATSSGLDMGLLVTRVRFAVLWLVVACAMAGSFAVFFAEPGRLAEGVTGVLEGEPVTWGWAYLYAAMVGLPLALSAATLFLPARAGAISNLVLGVPLGAFGLFAMVSEAAEGALHPACDLGCGRRCDRVAHRGPQRCPVAPAVTPGCIDRIGSGRHNASRRLANRAARIGNALVAAEWGDR